MDQTSVDFPRACEVRWNGRLGNASARPVRAIQMASIERSSSYLALAFVGGHPGGEPEYLLNADAPLTMRFDPRTIWNILWEGFRVHMLLQNNAGHFGRLVSGH